MTIGDLARISGVPPTTIRYYDSLGLIDGVRAGGHRRFDDAAARRLAVIQTLKVGGFTLDEIRDLLRRDAASTGAREAIVSERLQEVRASIRRLRAVEKALEETIECGCASIEHCDRMPTERATRGAERDAPRSSIPRNRR
jgi:MerR family redox-sensitive transcriptional activator SoxR